MSALANLKPLPSKRITFKFAPEKALSAIVWMLERSTPLDLHTILKTCYFADKDHLNKHGRPIFGATYRAMKFGPVPLEIYEMTKGEPLWLPELEIGEYPWRMDGHHLCRLQNAPVDTVHLSKSDSIALKAAFERSSKMTFNERTAATHGRDWQAARLGTMRYEDMLNETPSKDELVAYLRETGPFLKL